MNNPNPCPIAAIMFASKTEEDAQAFLLTWIEGDWETLRREFPDFDCTIEAKESK